MSRSARRPQRSKRERAQATLFTPAAACPATREAVASYGRPGCPLCGALPAAHYPEAADVVRDDGGDFGAFMLSLPRSPS